ncbi:MAG: PepSY domain-containing protein [Steroidobacteraceae bacterium]
MIRLLFLLHRYLGIAVGVLMAMWCLTGVVMMYVSYPNLDENDRLHDLAAIDWSGCCKIAEQALDDGAPISDVQLEMLAGRPVLYLRDAQASRLVDLTTGTAISRVSPEQALTVARAADTSGAVDAPRLLDVIDYDQWTVSGEFNPDRPLYRFALGDAQRTEIYISSATGRAVQATTGRQRFWNWVGAVPHWLYFTELRHRAAVWTQVVIVASSVGFFLVVTGLYIGLRQLLLRPAGRFSPYEGFNLWHHVAGLVFGIFTLSWILSGLLSMNPWGWLERGGARQERALLQGMSLISGADIRAALKAIAANGPSGVVSVKMAPFNGHLYFVASTADGGRQRLSADGTPAPLNESNLKFVAGVLGGMGATEHLELLTREDDYYFSHHRDSVPLPVYRIVRADPPAARYYVDAISGELLAKIDRGAEGYRWLHEGLHRMDFTAGMRARPQWDILMLLLMSGVTAVCITGTYLGCRRLLR